MNFEGYIKTTAWSILLKFVHTFSSLPLCICNLPLGLPSFPKDSLLQKTTAGRGAFALLKTLFCLSSWMNEFTWTQNFRFKLFSLSILKILFPCILHPLLLLKSLLLFSDTGICLFPVVTFLDLLFAVSTTRSVSKYKFKLTYTDWGSVCFESLVIHVIHQCWEILAHYQFEYFLFCDSEIPTTKILDFLILSSLLTFCYGLNVPPKNHMLEA